MEGFCEAPLSSTTTDPDLRQMTQTALQNLADSIDKLRHTIVVSVGRWDNCSRKGPELQHRGRRKPGVDHVISRAATNWRPHDWFNKVSLLRIEGIHL